MSGPIGNTFVYNIVILFILVVFAFLMGSLSYYKAFKVNNHIVNAIEKFEGYNTDSAKEIDNILTTLGYQTVDNKKDCPSEYRGYTLDNSVDGKFKYCIYIDKETPKKGQYYTYGVLTYMAIDLPIVDRISLPIFTRTNRIYKFTNKTH